MSEETYARLRELLHRMPGGFPATESGVEMRILSKLFSLEDAETAVCLSRDPLSPSEVARRLGTDEQEAAERLASMASRGLIYRDGEGDDARYRLEQFIVGIYEYNLGSMDRELAEMVEEYIPHIGLAMAGAKTLQTRFVPVGSAVEGNHAVATHDRIRELVREHEFLGVKECICRKQQRLLGKGCENPLEICLMFGDFARYHLENGWPGRRIDVEEALRLLDRSEELGLVLLAENARQIRFVCSCCACCCSGLRIMRALPNPGEILHSNYRSVLDAGRCDGCGICLERCPMYAISQANGVAAIDPRRCIGCGVCIPTCPQEAISLEEREDAVVPPRDKRETMRRILEERGLE
ncbi:MAG: 4Fe-4S binding protein [Actinobacteria bacterium]|nr:4Fe-4S binding protein [Actinomycetota bacterium]